MGWKAVKEHYKIGHIVHVRDGNICIGSSYIPDLIMINPEGILFKSCDRAENNELARYQREMREDPAMLARLVNQMDTFAASITVYTYDKSEIIEKKCEALGWPNVTHDGCLMYENLFSSNRSIVVDWAKGSAVLGVRYAESRVKQLKTELMEAEKDLCLKIEEMETLLKSEQE